MATIILAGGQSARMGRDKALLKAGGETILEALVQRFQGVAGEVLVCARADQSLGVSDARIVRDQFADSGPLAGLHAGLAASEDEVNFVVGCDYPLAKREVAGLLLERLGDGMAAVGEVGGRLQPLQAAYSARCLPEVERSIAAGKRRMTEFVRELPCVRVGEDELMLVDRELYSFLNMNTPEDYARALELMSRTSA